MIIKQIKPHVAHQGIGDKLFIVDEQITKTLTNDSVFDMGMVQGNWACRNFIMRRRDFDSNFPHKLYYGKVDGLGYVVAEDELEDLDEETLKIYRRKFSNESND